MNSLWFSIQIFMLIFHRERSKEERRKEGKWKEKKVKLGSKEARGKEIRKKCGKTKNGKEEQGGGNQVRGCMESLAGNDTGNKKLRKKKGGDEIWES